MASGGASGERRLDDPVEVPANAEPGADRRRGFPLDAFAAAPVAVLGTVTPDGAPHLVPVVFAVRDDVLFTAVDAKPKTTTRLRRLANVAANPRVSLLVEHYADDWTQLWWVRADGDADVHEGGGTMATAYALLREKYWQYQQLVLDGPVIAVRVSRWSSWHA